MLNDTHLKIIWANYAEDTKKKLQSCVLMKNTTESVPPVSSFLDFIWYLKNFLKTNNQILFIAIEQIYQTLFHENLFEFLIGHQV